MNQARKPGEAPYTTRTPRVSAALKLHRRRERDKTGLFLAEGPQAVREALAAGVVRELFVTAAFAQDHHDFAENARSFAREGTISPNLRGSSRGAPSAARGAAPAAAASIVTDEAMAAASIVTDGAMAALAETVTPQGVIAVCEQLDLPLDAAVARSPRLVAVAVDIRDPGNAGTILRTADAAGAGLVVFAGDSVDPYNGKCVRASAGSLFHVDLVRDRDIDSVLSALAGHQVLATTGRAKLDLFELEARLAAPTAWLFGGEAHGLPDDVLERAEGVRIPIYGGAESLNLAAAAAVCLYASARAQRSSHEL